MLDRIATILLIIGGLNWGLVGLANIDLVAQLFGRNSTLARAVYILVGIAAVYGILMLIRMMRRRSFFR